MLTSMPDIDFERSYFFDHGLRFACQGCGSCCTGAPGTIYIDQTEIQRIAGYMGMETAPFIEKFLYPFKDSYSIHEDDQGACLFFNNGCIVYPVRPLQCRSYPFWFCNLRSASRWRHVQRECPGIGRGRLFAKSEIMSIARATMHI